jgi:hypothetical protein
MAITQNGAVGVSVDAPATLSNKTLASPIFTGQVTGLELAFAQSIVFEGTTANDFETTLSAGDPTADRTITLPDATGTIVLADNTQTLSNKTLSSPTFTGQVTGLELAFAQSIVFEGTTDDAFETTFSAGDPTADRTITLPDATGTVALTSDITVTETSTSTLSNKTLTAPKFADLGFIADANGNELIILDTVASAVNEVTLANAATLGTPTLTASGTDTNISLDLIPKGTGTVKAGGVDVVTTTGTQTLTNKTLTSPEISGLYLSDSSIIFEGSSADAFETTFTVTNPTADRTITFPDSSGTVAFSTSVDAAVSTLSSLEIAVIMSAF